jgi:large subunit ribosomal protein L25
MAEVISLSARARDRAGTGAARATRREGLVPAVIYGATEPPLSIAVEPKRLNKELGRTGFFTTLVDMDVGGTKHRVLARDVQYHPVTDMPLHVDFLRVSAATLITVEVPVLFENEEESPGLKRGGVLNVVRHTIELSCRADAIPQMLTADLTGLEIGDNLHISNITLPDGVTPTITDRDFTVATVAAPTVVRDEEAEAQAEAEGEEGELAEGEEAAEGEGEEGAEGEAKEGAEEEKKEGGE